MDNRFLAQPNCRLVTFSITYGLPDHKNLVKEFINQIHDLVPDLPELHKFLRFWEYNIEGKIRLVQVTYPGIKIPRHVRHAGSLHLLN